MRKLLLSTSLMMLSVALNADASTPAHIGNITYESATIPSLQAIGNVTLKKTTIMGEAVINGNLTSKKSTIGSLSVNGLTNLQKTTVQSKSIYNGYFTADSSSLADAVIGSNRIHLSATTATVIVIKSVSAVICLDKGSVVNNINFTAGKGTIYLVDSASSVTKMSNAVIKHEACPK